MATSMSGRTVEASTPAQFSLDGHEAAVLRRRGLGLRRLVTTDLAQQRLQRGDGARLGELVW